MIPLQSVTSRNLCQPDCPSGAVLEAPAFVAGLDDVAVVSVETADGVEQQLSADLGEGQIAELIEDDEVETGEEVGEPPLAAGAPFGLEAVDQVNGVEEASARPGSDTAPRNGDRQMRFSGTGAADQHHVALLHDEVAAGEMIGVP
jgi:hypothetical protein